MFTRSLAACLAAATLATTITSPANAYELTVKGDTCTVIFSPEELALAYELGIVVVSPEILSKPETKKRVKALSRGLNHFNEAIAQAEQELKNTGITPEKKTELQIRIEHFKKERKDSLIRLDALTNCVNDKNHSQKEDDAKAALSSEDGKPNDAGIGLIVGGVILGVVGLIAAALPALAPMLPAQIRAMLHI